jgi:type II secretory pathway component PulJ
MKIKRHAYALTEILVIIVILVVLISLTVRPLRMMISEIPRSARVCQTLNTTTKALDQLRDDVERAGRIAGLESGMLTLEQPDGMVRYTLADGQITRRPAMNDASTEYTWQLPHLKTEAKLWSDSEQPYAVELTTWNQQNALGRDDVRFKQTAVFFQKGKQ